MTIIKPIGINIYGKERILIFGLGIVSIEPVGREMLLLAFPIEPIEIMSAEIKDKNKIKTNKRENSFFILFPFLLAFITEFFIIIWMVNYIEDKGNYFNFFIIC